MDQRGGNWVDGEALHGLVAARAAERPRTLAWRPALDLALVATLATAAPLAAFALKVGAAAAVAWGCNALAAVSVGLLWVLRREPRARLDGVRVRPGFATAATGPPPSPSPWRDAILRLLPGVGRHAAAPRRKAATRAGTPRFGRRRP